MFNRIVSSSPRIVAVIALVLLSRGASAEVVTNMFVPLNATVNNACTGEPVTLTGELHVLASIQETGNGLRISMHTQPVGATGTGSVSGATYHATGITRQFIFLDGPPPQDRTFVNNFYIIGEGSAPNFMVHTTIHLTVDADNNVTTNVLNTNTSCH